MPLPVSDSHSSCGTRLLKRPSSPVSTTLFGTSKTVRGILASLLVTSACAPLVGLEWTVGLIVAAASMTGDLFSSFVKRRLGLRSGGLAIGLDQIPESLFPLLAVGDALALTVWDVAAGVAVFLIGDILLSPLLQRLGIRDRPQ